MRSNLLALAALCVLCSGCELSTSVDAFVEPMYSVDGYLSFQQNDRLFFTITTDSVTSPDEALAWNANFVGAEADSVDVQVVQGDRVSTDLFRVVLPEIWYHPLDALGQSFVISSNVVKDVRIGRDSMVFFDRTRMKNTLYPLSYRAGSIGNINLVETGIPVSLYGRQILVDRYRVDVDDAQSIVVDVEPGATIVRTVSITPNSNGTKYSVRTCYYQRVAHALTRVISTK
jgi:hypothetical protein